MGDKREYGYSPDYSVAPGETLLETIQALGIYQAELGIAPGIVVGRLQHDGEIPRSYFNDLKRHVDFDLCAYFRSVPDR